jgi:hypothetical protein
MKNKRQIKNVKQIKRKKQNKKNKQMKTNTVSIARFKHLKHFLLQLQMLGRIIGLVFRPDWQTLSRQHTGF